MSLYPAEKGWLKLTLSGILYKSHPYGAVIETARVSRDMRQANGSIVNYHEQRRQGRTGGKIGARRENIRVLPVAHFCRALFCGSSR